jgi:hypothetical protein
MFFKHRSITAEQKESLASDCKYTLGTFHFQSFLLLVRYPKLKIFSSGSIPLLANKASAAT